MKKILASMLSAVCVFALFAGCSKNDDSGNSGSPTPPVEKGIVWEGCDDVTIARGDRLNLTEGIAVRYDGKDITSTLYVKDDGGFDSNYVGKTIIIYEAMNDSGEFFEKERKISVVLAHNVSGGEFDNKATYNAFQFDTPSGKGSYAVKNQEAVFTITDSANQWWSLQFYQINLYLTKDVTYRFTFDAKSSTGHSISAGFEEVNNNNRMMQSGTKTVKLTEDWQKYSLTYTSDADVMNAKAVIYLGWQLPGDDGDHEIIIDNVYIEKVEESANKPVFSGLTEESLYDGSSFDVNEGVSCKDKNGKDITYTVSGLIPAYSQKDCTYVLEYEATDSDGNYVSALRNIKMELERDHVYNFINSDFSSGLAGWNLEVMQTVGSGDIEYETTNGELIVKVKNPSDMEHHIQLYQPVYQFVSGETYTLTVKVKASAIRILQVDIKDETTSEYIVSQRFDVSTEYAEYTFTFTATKDYAALKAGMLLGRIGNTAENIDLTFDYIKIEKTTIGE